ncbi:MAG: glycosyltransferase, partial [Acetivibrio ethanolgignens]
MEKVLIVTSVASMIDQFNMPNISLLQSMGYEVHVACNFEKGSTCSAEKIEELKKKLVEEKVRYFQIDFLRSALKLSEHKRAYKQLDKIAKENRYIFMHCHSPIGGVIGRMVAHKYKVKVIYTAHGFHFYKGAPLKNWFLYYPIEKLCSRWTDVMITINKEDYALAKKKMYAKKVEYVPGVGMDTAKFGAGKREENRVRIRAELGIPKEARLLLSVGELNENKNHEIVIQASAELSEIKAGEVYYAIVGKGELEGKLRELIKSLKLEKQIFLLGFRNDIAAIYDAADIFVFPSKREGLSMALMEAMARGL